ncbi:hypothetical protein GCM10011360_02200 [Primorskyibacter flagellatus]|uniref:glutathione-specific gamma-glutamylcyclotransferase n=1 Tax=Primorskyibacter flagellatus TaxID=1387277 RepID=A0A916ZWG6_9RHOB|nr:gamma-glutamylcyclotransferase [Primorskyibacter flagellatus]GGE16975.1 hypothetical protein GCM10011360_02200 [Primorskyibacter flagellatus]
MPIPESAFRTHPELRALIRDPEKSFFRDFDVEEVDRRMAERGVPMPWRWPDAEREANRHAFFAGHEGPVWVFAYGSLMWDPAILFDDVRPALLEGYSRAMCLVDRRGARGDAQAPGLMAGLAEGGSCHGIVFRVPEALVEDETERLWRREMIAQAYRPVLAPAMTPEGPVMAVAFAADREADNIDIGLSRALQVQYIATGRGFLGTSLEYLENTLAQFDRMGIDDPDLSALLADARRAAAEAGVSPAAGVAGGGSAGR